MKQAAIILLAIVLFGCKTTEPIQEKIDCPINDPVLLAAKKRPPKPSTITCEKVAELTWGDLMGYSYTEVAVWDDSTSSQCCTCFQDDLKIIDARLNNGQINVAYLNFDGGIILDEPWGSFQFAPSGLTDSQITVIIAEVKSFYVGRNIVITTDHNLYLNTPTANRQQINFTTSCTWYGGCGSGGTSIRNSFGKSISSWVFTEALKFMTIRIGRAGAHEIGHTLGLLHQSKWQKI